MLRSVAILSVTNRITAGEETNRIHEFLKTQLGVLNFQVEKLVIALEHETVLTQEIDTLFKQYDLIIVVVELKNDVVFKALGNIFGDYLKMNDSTKKPKFCDDNMMKLPSLAKLLTTNNLPYPVIYLQRIFILKEECVEIQFLEVLRSHLEQYRTPPIFKKNIQVNLNGNCKKISDLLNELVNVEIKKNDSTLAVSSNSFENMVEAVEILKRELHENFLHSDEDEDALKKIFESENEHLQKSLKVIDKCISIYGPSNVFVSFNGGKDCTVLLHLIYIVLKLKYQQYNEPIICLYVKSQETFPEQDLFISQCQTYYNLDVMVVSMGIKEALNHILNVKPNLKACLMGTRRTDPYSQNLMEFQMTDPDWPQILRVSPLLDWHYSDIWDYILFYKIPYCKLYDLGYTSLGNSSNTIRNPLLSYFDDKLNKEVYLPAYKLTNETDERNGRNVVTQ
ncbi:FAD synthase-like [Diorhabda sublineata]|uniref:FAD synthase-like n=1 Tax=Diorhabda sublineata TaxID=1163346 RepID=UPI0024E09AB6|nr:FAD synthase-like [Diorhabda sublineata]